MSRQNNLKIMSVNAGYLLDYDGSLSGYVLKPHRAAIGSEAAENRALERLVDVIVDVGPDVVCLVEVDQGSIRTATDGQVAGIAAACKERGFEFEPHSTSKYGEGGLLARFPILDKLSNGVLTKDSYKYLTHFLDTGPKRLVQEVRIDGKLSLFLVHLAMRESTRQKQLWEIADLVSRRDSAIVCGDFNTYGGLDELEILVEDTGLEMHVPGETVPKRPFDFLVTETRTLDLFLTTENVDVEHCDVIGVQISDHRPIVLEVAGW